MVKEDRTVLSVCYRETKPVYPDMNLYQEVLFLKHHFKGRWVVENVMPYYEPLIEAIILQRHLFWSNSSINCFKFDSDKIRTAQIPDLQKIHGFDLSKFKLENKRQVLRNCVLPELGLHVFLEVTDERQRRLEF